MWSKWHSVTLLQHIMDQYISETCSCCTLLKINELPLIHCACDMYHIQLCSQIHTYTYMPYTVKHTPVYTSPTSVQLCTHASPICEPYSYCIYACDGEPPTEHIWKLYTYMFTQSWHMMPTDGWGRMVGNSVRSQCWVRKWK